MNNLIYDRMNTLYNSMTTPSAGSNNHKQKCWYANINITHYEPSVPWKEGLYEKLFLGTFQDQLKWLNFLWESKKFLLSKIYGLVSRFLICYWDLLVLDLPGVKIFLLSIYYGLISLEKSRLSSRQLLMSYRFFSSLIWR